MEDVRQIRTISRCVAAYCKYPRISVRELHKRCSHYQQRRSTTKLLKDAIEESVLIGPRIWCNSGIDVEIHRGLEDPFEFLEENRKRSEITYIAALIGDLSAFCLKKGASVLQYAETVLPSYPAQKTLDQITLEEKGDLPSDQYPHGWDQLDWDVYEVMRNPLTSYAKAGSQLDVSWHTVKDRFEKIAKDCKTWILFLPKGYDNYQQTYLMFKTEYEANLREELQKLDRTSIIYKFNDTILLHLFLDEALLKLHHYYRLFFELKKEGIIHDLHVSTPIEWYTRHW
ncbi:MAG: hypothetical protein HXS46_04460 [Theionarchaea archaeon]|nr:MAG: hypothetical protein AYK18_11145 [Theionarchaea archaeon DG-70]MBU7009917.1 hypothetical protein [Theionarchaea archaeon]